MLSLTFQQRIRAVWGQAGEQWISSFDDTLKEVSARWNLSNVRPFPNLSYNFVAQAVRNRESVVLKLAVDPNDLASEMRALEVFAGHGTAGLFAHEGNALLLERLHPGIPLWQTWSEERDDEHTLIAAQVMQELWRPTSQEFSTTAQWLRAFRKYCEQSIQPLPRILVDKAIQLATDLEQQANEHLLLHGDLHHGNILSHGEAYKAIDPKGVIGDKAFEAGTWIRNPCDRILQIYNLRSLIERRLKIIADVTQEDFQKLKAWSFVGCVLSAVWSVEEGDGWEEAIACAHALD